MRRWVSGPLGSIFIREKHVLTTNCNPTAKRASRRFGLCAIPLVSLAAFFCSSCGDIFSPQFVDVLDPTGQSASISNAPGHVVVAFVNNATVDERIITYLESEEGGNLELTDAEKRSLRPVLRFDVVVTFTDGSTQVVEFTSGSRFLVEPGVAGIAEQQLNDPDLTNAVVVCDVDRVEVLDGSIEVFVPVTIDGFEFQEPTDNNQAFFHQTVALPPGFDFLMQDVITEDGTVMEANVSPRGQPAPIDNPRCGRVVTIVANGVLSVPFLNEPEAGGVPSYDVEDIFQTQGIGGRYSFVVSVR